MLNPVKVLDGKGNVKKIIPSEELQERHWKIINKNDSNNLFAVGKGRPTIALALRSIDCGICGTSFKSTHKKAKYCGKMCSEKAGGLKRKGLSLKNEKDKNNPSNAFKDTPEGEKRERRQENKKRGFVPWDEPYERRKNYPQKNDS